MANDLKWALASDFHFPYHDPRYVSLWWKVLKWFKPDVIDYLGDISDQDCYSRFVDGRTNEFLNQIKNAELTGTLPIVIEQEKISREFYRDTRSLFPNAEIFAALGNHDIRVFDYADKKMPAILEQITPEALWDFGNLGIPYIYYNTPPKQRYGDIHVHHGHAISKHSGESVKADIDTFGVSIIRGHSHRMGAYFKTYELRNETLRGYEIGHNTDIHSSGMSYSPAKNWQPGFMIGHIESGVSYTADGYYPHLQLVHVSPNYTCFIDGKKFAA